MGSSNTAVGVYAASRITNSQNNTAIGVDAGAHYDLGWNNTIVGANSDGSFTGQYNIVAIGQGVVCPDNSTARIGNTATYSIGGYASWTTFSDGRYRTNIKEDVQGLAFILKLWPVTYNLDLAVQKKSKENGDAEWDEKMKEAMAEKQHMRFSGLVAQEVEQAAKEAGYDFSGVDKPKNETGFYGLRYAEFVVPLIKAMQEVSTVNNELKNSLKN